MEQFKFQLPVNYRPSEKEPFMSQAQLEYFRRKLLIWKEEILEGSKETIKVLQTEKLNEADATDRASSELDLELELKARERDLRLLNKIDAALRRVEDGSYGYCEETGEPISLARLEARPIATLSIEAQELHERMERLYRFE